MAEAERAIFTNMCMIYDGEGNVLVQERVGTGWDGIAFPGGHVEKGEAFIDSVIREVWEETGLTIKNPVLCGVKHWAVKDNARYIVFLYRCGEYSGTVRSSDEGEVFWIKRSEIDNYTLPRSFREMVDIMESDVTGEMFWSADKDRWIIK